LSQMDIAMGIHFLLGVYPLVKLSMSS